MITVWKYFLKYLGLYGGKMEREFDLKELERELIHFFEDIADYQKYNIHITSISIKKEVQKNIIVFKTKRPGILIGKAGQRINALEKHLKKAFNLDNLNFELEEDLLWDFAHYDYNKN